MGYITMNAGKDIRGSILKWGLEHWGPRFDYCVVVDGNLTDEAKAYYNTIPNLRVVDAPWTNRHVDQYRHRNAAVDDGDWLLALDDDEAPSEQLMQFIENSMLQIAEERAINIFYLPSVTYIARWDQQAILGNFPRPEDFSVGFYQAEKWPEGEQRCLKRILYKNTAQVDFHHSNCGMHVTPMVVKKIFGRTVPADRPGILRTPYLHMKSLESFMINDCIYMMADPRPYNETPEKRGLTEEDVQVIEAVNQKYNYNDLLTFIKATKQESWPQELKNIALKYSDLEKYKGKACTRFYTLYYLLQKAESAPFEYTYDEVFTSWSENLYKETLKSFRSSLDSSQPSDRMMTIDRHLITPAFWKEITYVQKHDSDNVLSKT